MCVSNLSAEPPRLALIACNSSITELGAMNEDNSVSSVFVGRTTVDRNKEHRPQQEQLRGCELEGIMR